MRDDLDDIDLEEYPEDEPDERYPIAEFKNKTRLFQFGPGVDRVDLGGMISGYYLMPGRRRCISECSVDRSGQIFETYFFSTLNLNPCDPRLMFQHVKAGHLSYDHDPEIKLDLTKVEDDNGHSFWALDALIADRNRRYRKRLPVWWPYHRSDIHMNMWELYQAHRKAQIENIEFLLIRGQTGDPSWGDSDFYKCISCRREGNLRDALQAMPSSAPRQTYTNFNHAVIDARDPNQPFNESVFTLANAWVF